MSLSSHCYQATTRNKSETQTAFVYADHDATKTFIASDIALLQEATEGRKACAWAYHDDGRRVATRQTKTRLTEEHGHAICGVRVGGWYM